MENKKYKIIPFVQNIFKRKIIVIIHAEFGNIDLIWKKIKKFLTYLITIRKILNKWAVPVLTSWQPPDMNKSTTDTTAASSEKSLVGKEIKMFKK